MYIADQACVLAVHKQSDMGCSSSHIPHQKMINYREESENETSTTWDCRGEPDGEVCSNTSTCKFIGPEVKDFNRPFEPDRVLKNNHSKERQIEIPIAITSITNQVCWPGLTS